MIRRFWNFLRELRWLAVIALVVAVLSIAYAVYMLVLGDTLSSVISLGFSGLIFANLSRD